MFKSFDEIFQEFDLQFANELKPKKEKLKFIQEAELDSLKKMYKPVKPCESSRYIQNGQVYKWKTIILSSKFWLHCDSFEIARSMAIVGHPCLNGVPAYGEICERIKENNNLQFVVLESYDIKKSVVLKILCNGKVSWTVIDLIVLQYEIKKLS